MTERSRSDALVQAENSASPVQRLLAKRCRASRKKLCKIETIEQARDSGKALNADQETTLASKLRVQYGLEEDERLMPLLQEATKEEVDAAIKKFKEESLPALIEVKVQAKVKEAVDEALAQERARASEASVHAPEPEETKPEATTTTLNGYAGDEGQRRAARIAVRKLIDLLYFAQVFEETGGELQSLEREACLSFADQQGRDLTEEQLICLAALGRRMLTRPEGQLISHALAQDQCCELALYYVGLGEQPEEGPLPMSVEEAAVRLDVVGGCGYSQAVPVLRDVEPPQLQHARQAALPAHLAMHQANGHHQPVQDPRDARAEALVNGFINGAAGAARDTSGDTTPMPAAEPEPVHAATFTTGSFATSSLPTFGFHTQPMGQDDAPRHHGPMPHSQPPVPVPLTSESLALHDRQPLTSAALALHDQGSFQRSPINFFADAPALSIAAPAGGLAPAAMAAQTHPPPQQQQQQPPQQQHGGSPQRAVQAPPRPTSDPGSDSPPVQAAPAAPAQGAAGAQAGQDAGSSTQQGTRQPRGEDRGRGGGRGGGHRGRGWDPRGGPGRGGRGGSRYEGGGGYRGGYRGRGPPRGGGQQNVQQQ